MPETASNFERVDIPLPLPPSFLPGGVDVVVDRAKGAVDYKSKPIIAICCAMRGEFSP
ncbi:hypothetical protein SBA5_1620004 [Candidatus Sulfotelmatomonas gaucii]|uniref:Uncharacterized protein n=1 Tax=Candidatus Sulfuritelmatomonas gaucii TaxID=2043161 RepID=A0A2N9L6W9_9BACT|nr:hypothetical protein SBA5_1620004 [Candidatus Sulfotelmatomonas gaucii]